MGCLFSKKQKQHKSNKQKQTLLAPEPNNIKSQQQTSNKHNNNNNNNTAEFYTTPAEELFEKNLTMKEKEIFINNFINFMIENKQCIIKNDSYGFCIGEMTGFLGVAVCEKLICNNELMHC